MTQAIQLNATSVFGPKPFYHAFGNHIDKDHRPFDVILDEETWFDSSNSLHVGVLKYEVELLFKELGAQDRPYSDTDIPLIELHMFNNVPGLDRETDWNRGYLVYQSLKHLGYHGALRPPQEWIVERYTAVEALKDSVR